MIEMDLKKCTSGTRRVLAVVGVLKVLAQQQPMDTTTELLHLHHMSEYMTDTDCEEVIELTETLNMVGLTEKCIEILQGTTYLIQH